MTLIELLVVLMLLAVTAAVVLPALTPPAIGADDDPTATVVASARRVAIRRAEPVRLRIDRDGVWALVTLHDGVTIDGGRLRNVGREAKRGAKRGAQKSSATDTSDAGIAVVLTIDALGSCQPGDHAAHDGSYDPLACRWTSSVAGPAALRTLGAR